MRHIFLIGSSGKVVGNQGLVTRVGLGFPPHLQKEEVRSRGWGGWRGFHRMAGGGKVWWPATLHHSSPGIAPQARGVGGMEKYHGNKRHRHPGSSHHACGLAFLWCLASLPWGKKAYSTKYSQVISHSSTNQACTYSASQIRGDPVHSEWYG